MKKEHSEHKKHSEHKHATKEQKMSSNQLTIIISIAAIIVIGLFIANIDRFVSPPVAEDKILVNVNGESIMMSELVTQLGMFPEGYADTLGQDEFKKRVLDQLIIKKLLVQEAVKNGITVTDEEAKAELAATLLDMGITEDTFKLQLAEQGLTIEDVNAMYKDIVLIQKFIDQDLMKDVVFTEAQIKEYYDQNKEFLDSAKASHILICFKGAEACEKDRTDEEALKLAEEVAVKAKTQDFAELAKEYSDGPSGPTGGDLGWFTKGSMVAEFENAVFAMEKGGVSVPVKTIFGYHVIKLFDKKTTYDELKGDIENQLKYEEQQTVLNDYLVMLKDNAEIEYVNPVETYAALTNIEQKLSEVEVTNAEITTFKMKDKDVCTEDGKPVVRLFSTTWCPHCKWIKPTFDSVMKELMDEGKIVAHHWEVDIGDDTLTDGIESSIPPAEMAVFSDFNPGSSIPTFVFGCKYYRIGNGFEGSGSLAEEEAEFRAVIEELVNEVSVN